MNIILTIILAASVLFTAYVMINAARHKPVNVFGRMILHVETGSMEPSLHVGDYIVVKETDTDTLQVGDIISFYSEDTDIYGMLVTHRIYEVKDDGTFITKGDANPVEDSVEVAPDRIVGKYTGKARFFIWVSSFASARKILMILVIIPISVVFILEIRSLAKLGKEVAENQRESEEERRQELMREAIEKEKARLAEEGYEAPEAEGVPAEETPEAEVPAEEAVEVPAVEAIEAAEAEANSQETQEEVKPDEPR